jgi:hypothetical protein
MFVRADTPKSKKDREAKRRRPLRVTARADASPYERQMGSCFSPQDIFERDEWVCGICDGDIDPDLGKHPMSACIDHIVPLKDGGENTPENVRAAHIACNSRRAHVNEFEPPAPLRFLTTCPQFTEDLAEASGKDDVFSEVEESLRREHIFKAVSALPWLERRILELRFGFNGEPWKLEEIGRELGLTRKQAVELEMRACARLAEQTPDEILDDLGNNA